MKPGAGLDDASVSLPTLAYSVIHCNDSYEFMIKSLALSQISCAIFNKSIQLSALLSYLQNGENAFLLSSLKHLVY